MREFRLTIDDKGPGLAAAAGAIAIGSLLAMPVLGLPGDLGLAAAALLMPGLALREYLLPGDMLRDDAALSAAKGTTHGVHVAASAAAILAMSGTAMPSHQGWFACAGVAGLSFAAAALWRSASLAARAQGIPFPSLGAIVGA